MESLNPKAVLTMEDFKGQGHRRLLDRVHALIAENSFNEGLDKLYAGLKYIWLNSTSLEWENFSRFACLKHPLLQILHADPFSSRAFYKPRGYAGDAVLTDLIYDRHRHLAEFQGTGAKLYAYTSDTAMPRAIRARREILARKIDETALRVKSPKILSMASGHLREADLSRAFENGSIAEWVAVDHDTESLETVSSAYGSNPCVRTISLSVRRMLQEKISLGEFDLVYASGLYDYLGQPVARLLTENLFSQLKSGGRLIVNNFLPRIDDIGYLETYMDWRLIYRDTSAMENLVEALPSGQVAEQKLFHDPHNHILFLELTRA